MTICIDFGSRIELFYNCSKLMKYDSSIGFRSDNKYRMFNCKDIKKFIVN